ncbi:hypothetical protein VTO42DRAFT_1290 [Malbranchea cinnamomea]
MIDSSERRTKLGVTTIAPSSTVLLCMCVYAVQGGGKARVNHSCDFAVCPWFVGASPSLSEKSCLLFGVHPPSSSLLHLPNISLPNIRCSLSKWPRKHGGRGGDRNQNQEIFCSRKMLLLSISPVQCGARHRRIPAFDWLESSLTIAGARRSHPPAPSFLSFRCILNSLPYVQPGGGEGKAGPRSNAIKPVVGALFCIFMFDSIGIRGPAEAFTSG